MTQHMHNWIAMSLSIVTALVITYEPVGNNPFHKLSSAIFYIGMMITIMGLWFIPY